jgi:hypothetical protein
MADGASETFRLQTENACGAPIPVVRVRMIKAQAWASARLSFSGIMR